MQTKGVWRLGLLLAVLALALAGCVHGAADEEEEDGAPAANGGEAAQAERQSVLERVKDRGQVVCGVNDSVPGFGLATEAGDYEGFDIDYCRVVAAAVLGDATKVELRPLTAEQRFTALQAGEIDVLIRNTTRTASRDGGEGARFLTTTYYDGQAMMVKSDSDFERLEDMGRTTICVLSGTTTELNLETIFRAREIPYEPLSFEETDPLQEAFIAGRCDGWTSDRSQLAGFRAQWPQNQGGPEAVRILDEIMSKEPLGPAVRDGDPQWADAVDWAILATIQAEEFGITSENVDQMTRSTNPDILRFLGQPVAAEEGEEPAPFDPGLGLEPDFAVAVIEQVGNYGEIFNRNIGPNTPLALERDINDLWSKDGLLYAPPYR